MAHYNGSAFVGEQIESILNSKLPDGVELHLLIIDDRSRADEFQKIEKLTQGKSNIKLIQNEINVGVTGTFERGLTLSKGDYVMLSDQDDFWLNDKIEKSLREIKSIEKGQPALVFTNLQPVDRSLSPVSGPMLKLDMKPSCLREALLFQNQAAGCTMIVNRSLLALALPFPKPIPMHDHWMALVAAFGGNIGYISEPTILYRQHSANAVGTPKRTLWHRLKTPVKTFQKLNQSIEIKGAQTIKLVHRLELAGKSESIPFLKKVAEAFEKKTLANLIFLLNSKVIIGNRTFKILVSIGYLIGSKPKPAQAIQ